jgi:hypothetical protein
MDLWRCGQHVVWLKALGDGVQLESVNCALAAFFSQDFCHKPERELLDIWVYSRSASSAIAQSCVLTAVIGCNHRLA